MTKLKCVSLYDDYTQSRILVLRCTQLSFFLGTREIVTKLEGIRVSTETAQEFVVNLGVTDVHSYSNFSDLKQICLTVMEQKEVIYPEEIIQAMVLTKGLGQFASSLACKSTYDIFIDNKLCVHNNILLTYHT